mmetsp:Transcript_36253/g.96353  ORF Transcript_36253/g.96353 Transcript_36253/m.96353 type:complete len:201 (+) Transcript_36253:1192-1794(+)
MGKTKRPPIATIGNLEPAAVPFKNGAAQSWIVMMYPMRQRKVETMTKKLKTACMPLPSRPGSLPNRLPRSKTWCRSAATTRIMMVQMFKPITARIVAQPASVEEPANDHGKLKMPVPSPPTTRFNAVCIWLTVPSGVSITTALVSLAKQTDPPSTKTLVEESISTLLCREAKGFFVWATKDIAAQRNPHQRRKADLEPES